MQPEIQHLLHIHPLMFRRRAVRLELLSGIGINGMLSAATV